MASKGKAVYTGKRKGKGYDDDKTGRKRNRQVLQFFEDTAEMDDDDEDDESDFSDFDDLMEDDFDIELKVKQEPGKTQNTPMIPKEEVMDEEEFDKMMEERYRNHPSFVRYAEDSNALGRDAILPSKKDPVIWKVKCMVGKERQSVFCLMQKFVDVKALGTKLQMISAFSIDHVKGFIFMEADKQNDINEVCKGLSTIYTSRVATVPLNEITHLFSLRSKSSEVTEGMWVRVKNGKYKGDLAQIAGVNNSRRKATVKLIPRIDLQMMAQKFGGGVTVKSDATPAPRLISSSELEEFRPLIIYRRDRDTGLMFEVLDGLMFKDGYLYKKVALDSLSCWGIIPTEEELLKFTLPESNESDDREWLIQLYGAKKTKKRTIGNDKGNEKGQGSSGSGDKFELYDLVCFGRKDFGLIVGMEKNDHYKILKEGPEGPVAVTLEQRMLKIGPSDMKFTALDQHKKIISVNDSVRILEGPLKDRQGIARQIYRGIVFVYDETEIENGGYFTLKAQNCEKVKLDFDMGSEKGGDSGAQGFEDFPSSPKSPLSPKKPWQAKDNTRNFHQEDALYSIGQTLRIRVGPLKGYLCRVVAIRRSDITVKLNSQQKVLTVKSEHLSEVRSRNSTSSASEDPGSSSFKPFDILGNEGGSAAWGDAAGTSTEGGWNAAGLSSNERTSWPSFGASGSTIPTNQSSGWDNDQSKENSAWERKVETNQNSSWGTAVADDLQIVNSDQNSDWGKSDGSWNKAAGNIGSFSNSSDGWAKACVDLADSSKKSGDSWGQVTLNVGNSSSNATGNWGKGEGTSGSQSIKWGNAATNEDKQDPWVKSKDGNEEGSSGKGKDSNTGEDLSNDASAWNQTSSKENASTWGKAIEVQGTAQVDAWGKASGNSDAKDSSGGNNTGWKTSNPTSGNQTSGWGVAGMSSIQAENADKLTTFGSNSGSWNKHEKSSWGGQGGSAWNKQDGGGTWKKQDCNEDGSDGWKKPFDGGRGSGRGWGRGGGRGGQGGRGQFGRGRSFGESNSSDWNKEGEGNKWSADGLSSWKPSGWSNNQSGGNRNDGNKEKSGSWGGGAKWNSGEVATDDNKINWNSGSSGAGRSWGGAKKTSWGSGSSDAGGNSNSAWGKKSDWDSGSNDGDGKDSSWGQKGNNNPVSGDKNQNTESSWGKKASWGSGSSDAGGNSDSAWGKKSDWNTGSNGDGDGKDLGWGQKGNGNPGSSDKIQNTESSWGKKTSWGSGSGDAAGNSDSTWGTKRTWNSGSSDGDGKDSSWEQKGNWNSGSSENTVSGWGKKTNWGTGSVDAVTGNADGNQESGWSKKSNWSSGSGDANQDSGWGRKSSFNFGGDNANESSVDGDSGTGGNWRGSFRARGGSDRGSFRGRGERGGFGGRGDRGGYGGRGGSDRGGFGRRDGGRGDRGGFNGREGGRGYQSWNDNNDSSQDKSYNWKNEGDNGAGGWKGNSSDGGGSWSQGGGRGNFKSWGASGSGENNQSGGWSSKSWNQGTNSNTDVPQDQGKNWKSSDSSGGGQWSSWGNSGKQIAGSTTQEGGWNKEEGSGTKGWGDKGSGGNKGADAADNATTGDQTKSSWNQSGNSGGTSSGWNKGADAADTVTTGDQTKSSWNQSGNTGGTSAGWNQSGNSGGSSLGWKKSEEKKGGGGDAGGETSGGWSSKGGW